MAEETSSVEGVLANFSTPVHPNIIREPTREGLIYIHRLINGNTASVVSNLRGGQHGHLAFKMTVKDYMEQTGF